MWKLEAYTESNKRKLLNNKFKNLEMDRKVLTENRQNRQEKEDPTPRDTSCETGPANQTQEKQLCDEPVDCILGMDYYGTNKARKSTGRVGKKKFASVKLLNRSSENDKNEPEPMAELIYFMPNQNGCMKPKLLVQHDCNPQCVYIVNEDLEKCGPLMKPLVSGWEREIIESSSGKLILYTTPCGNIIKTMKELHQYLVITNNVLNVTNFTFDLEVNCMRQFMAKNIIAQKHDISENKENIDIPCVNYRDNSMPNQFKYSTERTPTTGVLLNLDTEYLACCDCEDECSDKEKCSCWQLTLEGAKFQNVDPTNCGYQFKRLFEPTGAIYECNRNCKCSTKCLNRVVQHPLEIKLQVYKTKDRGWGLQCLNDIAKGSFICLYVGELLTDRTANEGGREDQYFANLDYLDVAENYKADYESDVENEIEFEKNISDEDFNTSKKRSKNNRQRDRTNNKNFSGKSKHRKRKDANNNFKYNRNPRITKNPHNKIVKTRQLFGINESSYVMDAKRLGNVGRFLNHSCSPNVFVQNVFVDTHDVRFPWVAFFAMDNIRCGTELTWDYNYEKGAVPGRVLYCKCGSKFCRGRLL